MSTWTVIPKGSGVLRLLRDGEPVAFLWDDGSPPDWDAEGASPSRHVFRDDAEERYPDDPKPMTRFADEQRRSVTDVPGQA